MSVITPGTDLESVLGDRVSVLSQNPSHLCACMNAVGISASPAAEPAFSSSMKPQDPGLGALLKLNR